MPRERQASILPILCRRDMLRGMKNGHLHAIGVLLLTLGIFAAGCGPPWEVVRQSVPNPLYGQRSFIVEPILFNDVRVGDKPEDVYLGGKRPEQVASWNADKVAMTTEYIGHVIGRSPGLQIIPAPPQAPPPPNSFIVRAFCTFIEPGAYTYFVNIPTRVFLTVQVLTLNNQLVDEFRIRAWEPATAYNISVGGRLRAAGAGLGARVAYYLNTRVSHP